MKVELNNFYNCDCMDLLKALPDKYIDLAIVDPPYGIGEAGEKNASRGHKDIPATIYPNFVGIDSLPPPPAEYFNELFRVSKNQIIFGANHFISRFAKDSSCWLVWDKQNEGNDFADCELAWTSFKSAVRIFRFRWNGMLQGDMKNKEKRVHPNQKPLVLYRWILTNYAKNGDIILDTHCGSANSLIACWELGFDYIGCELDKYYYNIANERLEARKRQMKLF